IDNEGTATLSNSVFSGNTASEGGGGISNGGYLTVSGSTLSRNSAGFGGGIFNGLGGLSAKNCTFTSNSATYEGGRIYDVLYVGDDSNPKSSNTFKHNSPDDIYIKYVPYPQGILY